MSTKIKSWSGMTVAAVTRQAAMFGAEALKRDWILNCDCGAHMRLDAGATVTKINGRPAVACACGRVMGPELLKGHTVENVRCGAKCIASKGHVCDCSCGGKNHGRGAAA